MTALFDRSTVLRALAILLAVGVLALPLVGFECQRLQRIHDAHLEKHNQLSRPAGTIVGATNPGPPQSQAEQNELQAAYKFEAGRYAAMLFLPFGLVQALLMLLLPGPTRTRGLVRNTVTPGAMLFGGALLTLLVCRLFGIQHPIYADMLLLSLRHRLLEVPLARQGEHQTSARGKRFLEQKGLMVWAVLFVGWLLLRIGGGRTTTFFSGGRAWENLRPVWMDAAWLTLPAVVASGFLIVVGDIWRQRALGAVPHLSSRSAGEVFA